MAEASSASGLSIPFVGLDAQRSRIAREIDDAISRVLSHGRFILGPEVAEFEDRLAAFSGANAVVSCANGTDALELALRASGLRPGQAVLVPSFSFCSPAEAVAGLGGIPVFVDVDARTFCMDPASADAATQASRAAGLSVVGMIPVDHFGLPADYQSLNELANRKDIWVVADAAQSVGARYRGRGVGALAPIATTSFVPVKPLGCYGDGGAVFAQTEELAASIRSLRVHGRGADLSDHVQIGRNSRLDTLQAAILIAKLLIFEDELELRQQVAHRYEAALRDRVDVPRIPAGSESSWSHYTITVPPGQRQAIQDTLRSRGIPTVVYYPKPLHVQPAYADFPVAPGGLPVSERLAGSVLSLPMHPYLDADTQDRISGALVDALS
ncbi:MAG TPA: DegT/DnrJ/EryC1/StrS family aminotransferase [Acidobacteriota bacterium]|nr:DegT/DnrJ/EryC1/StrS family aminotransferase [Acidobacteriota bacterium]